MSEPTPKERADVIRASYEEFLVNSYAELLHPSYNVDFSNPQIMDLSSLQQDLVDISVALSKLDALSATVRQKTSSLNQLVADLEVGFRAFFHGDYEINNPKDCAEKTYVERAAYVYALTCGHQPTILKKLVRDFSGLLDSVRERYTHVNRQEMAIKIHIGCVQKTLYQQNGGVPYAPQYVELTGPSPDQTPMPRAKVKPSNAPPPAQTPPPIPSGL